MKQSGSLCVVPESLIFNNVQPGCSESKDLYVHNIGKRPIRVHFSIPINSSFAFLGNTSTMIAPGLEIKCSVRYFAAKNELNPSANLSIQCDDSKVILPILAATPSPSIKFKTNKIDLGITSPGVPITKQITICNSGSKECTISVTTNEENVTINPKTLTIFPKEEESITLIFTPKLTGDFQFDLIPTSKGEKIQISPLTIMCKVIRREVLLLYENEEISELNFGHIYFGQRKILRITLQNKCASTRSYVIMPPHDPANAMASKFPSTLNDPAVIFTAVPCEGILKPFSTASVSLIFGPPFDQNSSEQMFTHISTLKIIETKQTFDFQLTGIGMLPDFSIDRVDFDFGNQLVRTKQSQSFFIENHSPVLPISYDIKKVAQYRFDPISDTIKPNTKKEVKVIFFPKNLGEFELTTTVDISKGLVKRRLNLTGTAVAQNVENKKFKRTPIYETDQTAAFNARHPTNQYGMTLEEIEKKNELRQQFDGYIASQKNSLIKKIKDLNDEHSGLKPPNPPLIKNLPKQKSINNELIMDSNRKKRFKSKPTTSPEMDECSRLLSPAQQTQIIASSQSINFGIVSVYSRETKKFEITNNLNQHILISFDYCEELANSNPVSQVIPPQQTAEFDLVIHSTKPQKNFLKPIFFLVNNHHEYSLNIMAELVNIDVELSRDEIYFAFNDVGLYSTELITLYNKSNAVVHYHWSNFNETFSIAQESDTIQPKSSATAEIRYSPGTNSHSELIVLLNIAGETTKQLKLVGDMGKPRVVLEKSKIDLGVIPIQTGKDFSVKMKNTSSQMAIFSVEDSSDDQISISPLRGQINPGEVANLNLSLFLQKEVEFERRFFVTILGFQKLSFLVTAKSEIPSITILNDNLMFEKLYVGTSLSKPLMVQNNSNIFCVVKFDLSTFPDFRIIAKMALNESIELNEKGNCYFLNINPKTSIEINLIFQPSKICQFEFDLPVSILNPNAIFGGPIQNKNLNQKLKTNQKSKPKIETFNSTIEKVLNQNIFNPFECLDFPNKIVVASSIHSPLLPSESIVDFGLSSTIEKDNPNKCFQTRQILLKNQSKLPINFHFKNTSDIFIVKPSQGRINFSSHMSVLIEFQPKESIPYFYNLPLYVNLDDSESLVSTIQLTGVGSSRKFITSTNSLCLPIVPLGFKVERTIEVINTSYSLTKLKATIPLNEKSFPISISWPKGNEFNYTTLKLPLTISFECHYTLSFTTVVAIVDTEGHSYSFNLSGGCDNSIFSLYPFISYNKYYLYTDKGGSIQASFDNLSNSIEHQPISFLENSIQNDLLSNVMSFDHYENARPINNSKMNEFLVHFLNSIVFTNTIIQSFPGDFVNNGIELLNEMISNLTEKKLNLTSYSSIIQHLRSQGAILTTLKPEFLMKKADFLAETRNNLVKKLLGLDYFNAPSVDSIDAQFLSPFVNSPSFSNRLSTKLKEKEDLYDQISNESWIYVVLQIFKLYLVSKLKLDLFNTNGIEQALNQLTNETFLASNDQHNSSNELNLLNDVNKSNIDLNRSKSFQSSSSFNSEMSSTNTKISNKSKFSKSNRCLMSSNIFSPIESMLLKWISIHYSVITKHQVNFIDFHQLNDLSVFLALVESHIKRTIKDYSDLVDFLKEINASFCPFQEEILNGNDCMLCLILQFFYETLPYCIPTLSLNFTQNLLTKKVQSIEITNPSKFNLTYTGQIKGSTNFTLIRNQIELKGNETKKFEIEYFARSHNSEKATLLLIPNKPQINERPQTARNTMTPKKATKAPSSARFNKSSDSSELTLTNSIKNVNTFASTIVVNLFSTITIKSVYKSVDIEGQLYEPTKFTVQIDNPIELNGKFDLYTRIYQIEDENGKKITKDNSTKQIIQFFNDPFAQPSYLTATSKFTSIIEKHQPFLLQNKSIDFNTNSTSIDIEFVPIQLGLFRFLILFYNEKLGEFMYEINGHSKLPKEIETNQKIKIEANQSKTLHINFQIYNQKLFYALSYSICKQISLKTTVSETKFKDLLNFNLREIQSEFKKVFLQTKYTVKTTSSYFTYTNNSNKISNISYSTNSTISYSNTSHLNNSSYFNRSMKSTENLKETDFVVSKEDAELPITFCSDTPGEFQCHVLLLSDYDTRVFVINAIALMPTKKLLVEMTTTCGKQITQNLPFNNPSSSTWHYKVYIKGDSGFTVPDRFDITANSTYQLPLTFLSKDKGIYNCLLEVINYTKEITVKYNISCIVGEAQAEQIFEIKGRAKEPFEFSFPVKHFIDKGTVDVSSNLTILQFEPKLKIRKEETIFNFTANSPISGLTSGTITFHDPVTYRSIWYIVNIDFDRPLPEETIEVETVSRQSATIKIPVHNPSLTEIVSFDVTLSDDDLFGDKKLTLRPNETVIYELIYSPLVSIEKTSFVSFINEHYGEFIYQLNLKSEPPGINTFSALSAPIGQFATTTIKIENPIDKKVMFKIENSNDDNFLILENKIFSLNEREIKMITVKYVPSSIGINQFTYLKLISRDAGEWNYKLIGVGKPPQPMSPLIFNSFLNESKSNAIVFKNPFPFMSKFEFSLTNSDGFELLNHKKVFSLQNYGDEHSIAISFHPHVDKQFNGTVIVKSLTHDINWTYPLIGIVQTEKVKKLEINGIANQQIEQQIEFPLVAETDVFDKYSIELRYPNGFDWLMKYLEIKQIDVIKKNNSPHLVCLVKFRPKRAINSEVYVSVTNALKQTWNFAVLLNIKQSEPFSTIVIESNLQETSTCKIAIKKLFNERTAFHAYFANGSCHEFSLSVNKGYIEASLEEERELPFEILFTPKIYGKVLKGLLVIDTLEEQFLFDVVGKVPDYVPPVIKSGTIDTTMPLSARRYAESRNDTKKRNIIKDNIDSARRPKSNVRIKQVPRKEWR